MDANTAMTIRYYNSNICVGVGGASSPTEALNVFGNLKVGDGYRLKLPQVAFGTPTGAEGDLVYDSTSKVVKYYDGTNWIAL